MQPIDCWVPGCNVRRHCSAAYIMNGIVVDYVHTWRFRIVPKRNEAIRLVNKGASQKINQQNGFVSFPNNTEPSCVDMVFDKELWTTATIIILHPKDFNKCLEMNKLGQANHEAWILGNIPEKIFYNNSVIFLISCL